MDDKWLGVWLKSTFKLNTVAEADKEQSEIVHTYIQALEVYILD